MSQALDAKPRARDYLGAALAVVAVVVVMLAFFFVVQLVITAALAVAITILAWLAVPIAIAILIATAVIVFRPLYEFRKRGWEKALAEMFFRVGAALMIASILAMEFEALHINDALVVMVVSFGVMYLAVAVEKVAALLAARAKESSGA